MTSEVDARRITKIKLKGKDGNPTPIHIKLFKERAGGGADPDEWEVTCHDAPRPSLLAAMSALAQDVAGICELADTDGGLITVRSISLSYTEVKDIGLVMGAVITAHKRLTGCHAPLILNTPHLTDVPVSGGVEEPALPHATAERINTLIDEALAYVDGQREQCTFGFMSREKGQGTRDGGKSKQHKKKAA